MSSEARKSGGFKVLVFTPIWGRHEIVRLYQKGYQRLKSYWPEFFEFDQLAVVSNQADAVLCDELGIPYCTAPNKPLGQKHNMGLKHALTMEWDYIMQMGSDDIMHPELLHYYAGWMGIKDHFGVDRIYFTNLKRAMECRLTPGGVNSLIGAGRMISRKAIMKVQELWPNDINRSLDFFSQKRLVKRGYPAFVVRLDDTYLVDVKSQVNIWKYEDLERACKKIELREIEKFEISRPHSI